VRHDLKIPGFEEEPELPESPAEGAGMVGRT